MPTEPAEMIKTPLDPSDRPAESSYDSVPYMSHPFRQSHPERLATVARLLGLAAPPIEKATVLELGCAAGGNLIPIAAMYPQARCVGVDLSPRQIEDGQETIKKLGIKNCLLYAGDVRRLNDRLGQYDYIICHGVYSWVPEEVQARLWEIATNHLKPEGIFYLSYNTYPGWHFREAIRHMMLFHAKRFGTPGEQVGQARALLDFLAGASKDEQTHYSQFFATGTRAVANRRRLLLVPRPHGRE